MRCKLSNTFAVTLSIFEELSLMKGNKSVLSVPLAASLQLSVPFFTSLFSPKANGTDLCSLC